MEELVELLVADYLDDVDVSLSTMAHRSRRIEYLTATLPMHELVEAEIKALSIIAASTNYASGVPIQGS